MNLKNELMRKSFVEKADNDMKEVLKESGCTQEEYESEPEIDSADFLREIYILIKEYFKGNFIYTESGIECNFLNGNRFKICTKKAE